MIDARFKKLFLSSGKFRYIFIKPVLNPKITCHFRYPDTDICVTVSKAFQTKCQLMPHFICHYSDYPDSVIHSQSSDSVPGYSSPRLVLPEKESSPFRFPCGVRGVFKCVRSVLFPHPLFPQRTRNSPSSTCKET